MAMGFIIVGLTLWMLACVWCGYKRRLLLFLAILCCAIGANSTWIAFGLNTNPLSPDAILAHIAALLYAGSSFIFGWLISRIANAFRESRVDPLQ